MDPDLGPLEYAVGSHRWGDGRVGSAAQFFDAKDRHALLHDAARRAGISDPVTEVRIERLEVRAGGAGVHDGRLWHGSGPNRSDAPRRGLGIHFVPADAVFRDVDAAGSGGDATHGPTLAHRWRDPGGGSALPDESFPVAWAPAGPAPPR